MLFGKRLKLEHSHFTRLTSTKGAHLLPSITNLPKIHRANQINHSSNPVSDLKSLKTSKSSEQYRQSKIKHLTTGSCI